MFTELHCHGYYSIMDGFNSPAELVSVAKELGHTAASLTDHGTLAGHRELQRACKEQGIKPILGVEAYISPTDRFDRRAIKKRDDNTQVYNHIILQAKSQAGLRNLQAMSETAWAEGYYHKPRIDKELLSQYGDDVIVLSGCMNGLISKAAWRALEAYGDVDDNTDPASVLKLFNDGGIEKAQDWTKFMSERFGADFYMELQPHNPPWLNRVLYELAVRNDVRPVVTNDCHFSTESERAAEEVMLILSTNPKDSGKYYNDVKHLDFFDMLNALYPERPISFAELDLFLKSETDVHADLVKSFELAGIPTSVAGACIEATEEVSDKVGDYEYYEAVDLLPKISIDAGKTDAQLLRDKCDSWLAELATNNLDETVQKYRDRLDEELKVIEDLKFSRYFLIVADVIDYARSQNILIGPGRGSAGGSLVCYSLGITQVDPIEHNLLFFRFLDPERGDWPDVDMDFPDDRRGEVIEYMRQKYGNVANISTYGFFKDKGVIKSAARALRVPYSEVMSMAKTIDTFEEYEESISNLDTAVGKFHAKYPLVLNFARKLRGKINLVGVHPAGIVVSSEPIDKYAPVETRKDTSTGERVPALVYDMEGAESIGLIKFDFLGLKTLSVISKALELADLKHADLPMNFDDKDVLREYLRGNTVGVFQAEQSAYTKLLKQMDEVDFTFADLVASNALVRPGAMKTVGKEYLARRAGHESVEYDHPEMESITKETYGVLIYQEQLMLAAVALGGFSMVEANKLRRIIGKKKDVAEFKPFEDKWMQNAGEKVGKEKAAKLWKDFQAHAGYSFNKSHAVEYSMLSYWTMWLKYHYPLEFMTAALASEKKTTNNPKWSKLMLETKRFGIEVLLPHVNLSSTEPSIYKGKILLGLTNIKYISDKVAAPLLKHRPFDSYAELLELSTTKGSGISTRVIGALNALNGAQFNDNPAKDVRDNLYDYIGIPSFVGHELKHPDRVTPLEDFEESGAYVLQGLVQKIKRGPGWSKVEILDETGTQGIFHDENTQIVEGTFYTFLVAANRIVDWLRPEQDRIFTRWLNADRLPGNLLLAIAPRTTKAGKEMATAVWSDPNFNLVGVLIFPGVYGKLKSKLQAGKLIDPFIGELDDGGYMLKGID